MTLARTNVGFWCFLKKETGATTVLSKHIALDVACTTNHFILYEIFKAWIKDAPLCHCRRIITGPLKLLQSVSAGQAVNRGLSVLWRFFVLLFFLSRINNKDLKWI